MTHCEDANSIVVLQNACLDFQAEAEDDSQSSSKDHLKIASRPGDSLPIHQVCIELDDPARGFIAWYDNHLRYSARCRVEC